MKFDERSRIGALLVAAATLLALLPFIGKAFHIDDPMYIWPAVRILSHPFDPYGFLVNWNDTLAPAWEVNQNPPLSNYFIALGGSLLGWSETALHLFFTIPAMAVTAGTFFLGRRLCSNPLPAGLAVVAAPAFLISATGIMCDTLMLALFVWAVILWLEGSSRDDIRILLLAGFLAGAAALTKYFGMVLLPLLAMHTVLRRERIVRHLLPLLLPAAMLFLYQSWTRDAYGQGLLQNAASYANLHNEISGITLLVGLGFAGGGFLPILLTAPLSLGRAMAALVTATAIAVGLAAGLSSGWPASVGLQMGLYAGGGLFLLILAAIDLSRRRDAESALIFAWISGTVIFASFFNWTITGRAILPLVPVSAILLLRRIEDSEAGFSWKRFGGPLAISAAVALLAAQGDATIANAQKDAAEQVRRAAAGRPVWYVGHWGFQYYMDLAGGEPVDHLSTILTPGDLVAVPWFNTAVSYFPENTLKPLAEFAGGSSPFVSTMSVTRGAGFYSSINGPLPFAFGPSPPEGCTLSVVANRWEGKSWEIAGD